MSRLLAKGANMLLLAEAIVRLHRQVEAYSTLLAVPNHHHHQQQQTQSQQISLDPFSFTQQISTLDDDDDDGNKNNNNTNTNTANNTNNNPNLDASSAMDMSGLQHPADPTATANQVQDGIDQVLDEAAAMGGLDNALDAGMNSMNDSDLNFDQLYGLEGDDMGLADLNDLDLDMF
jgi:hypothetical protein